MKEIYIESIDKKKEDIIEVNDIIWDYAECGLEEVNSSALLCHKLQQEGFRLIKNLANLSTAFMAEYGKGKPVIAVLGEYDALPGLSQQADSFEKKAGDGTNGHGCGHNCLAAGAYGATIGIKDYLEQTGSRGTIRFYGCPAEENFSAKAILARKGVFDDVDYALSWHPDDRNESVVSTNMANEKYRFSFYGKSAHAAIEPEKGRSALDAVELMNVGANYLREHVPSDVRFHYAISNSGAVEPNVVPNFAEVTYLIRAAKSETVSEVAKRVEDLAKGAALMTGTSYKSRMIKSCANMIPNVMLQKMLYESMCEIGVPKYEYSELWAATKYQQTFEESQQESAKENNMGAESADCNPLALSRVIRPFSEEVERSMASSDVGNVSRICPTGTISIVTWAEGTPMHSWQSVAQGKSIYAHKGVLYAAKVLADTAVKLIKQPYDNDKTTLR